MIKAIAAAALLSLFSQGWAQQPTFDAASIKPSKAESGSSSWNSRSGNLVMRNQTLIDCIRIAYQLKADQITGGPDWMNSDRFDIEARASDPAKGPELLAMLQTLLTERFQLKFHRDQKLIVGYTLTIATNGLKVRPAAAGLRGMNWTRSTPGSAMRLTAERVTMDKLANGLAQILGAPVVNSTSTSGEYSFELEWSPESTQLTARQEAPDVSLGPSLFTVLQNQLGLKQEPRKEQVEVLVIDAAEELR